MSKRPQVEKDEVIRLIQLMMPDQFPDDYAVWLVNEFWDAICDDVEGKSTGDPMIDAALIRLGGRVDG